MNSAKTLAKWTRTGKCVYDVYNCMSHVLGNDTELNQFAA